MRKSRLGWTLAVGLMVGVTPVELHPFPFGARGANAAPAQRDRVGDSRTKTRKVSRPTPRKLNASKPSLAPPLARRGGAGVGFSRADGFVYTPAFSAALHRGSTVNFRTVINPLVSQEYPATPEYTYMYLSSSLLRAPPAATPYRYVADNRALLSPAASAEAVVDAYSWRRTFLDPATARANAMNARMLTRPTRGRASADEIADGLRREALGTGSDGSELNSALRSLRLPAR